MIKQMKNKTMIQIAFLVVGILLAVFASTAHATTPVITELPPGTTVTVQEHNATKTKKDSATKNFVILSFIKAKGLSEKVVDHSECRMIGAGTNVPEYTNSGYSASGGLFKFADTTRTEVCKVNGQWRKVLCGNFVWFSVQPEVFRGRVIMVRSFAHVKFTIHVVAKVKATGSCGYAYASAKVNQRVSLKLFAKTKGASAIRIYAKVVDKATAKAKAEVHCETTITVVPGCKSCIPPPCCEPPHECPPGSVPSGEKCVKDGSATPEKPVSNPAPGPNPSPSGGAGDPGSHRCYNENDPSIWIEPANGLCPSGYYG